MSFPRRRESRILGILTILFNKLQLFQKADDNLIAIYLHVSLIVKNWSIKNFRNFDQILMLAGFIDFGYH